MYSVKGNINRRRIIFEGNSIFALGADSVAGTTNTQFIPNQLYTQMAVPYCMNSFAISAQTQATINSNISTRITPLVKLGDIVVCWEGTNDISGGLTGVQAYANLVTYCDTVRALGAKVVIATTISRGASSNPNQQDECVAMNALINANYSTIADAFYDPFANSVFNTVAACSNTTYYKDTIHPATAGQNILISGFLTAIQTLL